jgi:foldase protein PrsA
MENTENHVQDTSPIQESSKRSEPVVKRFKGELFIAGGAILLLAVLVFIGKSLFIAATVNGSPISRLSVVRALEKQSGKAALESMIQKKLIETELKKQNITVTEEEVNAEIRLIEQEVIGQGGTLKAALEAQGVTKETLREQITIQKRLEKALSDKVQVSDADLEALKKQNDLKPAQGQSMGDFNKGLKDRLKRQKFQEEASKWVESLTNNAKINYYVQY